MSTMIDSLTPGVTFPPIKKLGFMIPNLGANQLAFYFIKKTNLLLSGKTDYDIIAFYENLHRNVCQPHFSVMQLGEAYNYAAPVVATNVVLADQLIRMPSPTKKIFYVWDLDWHRGNYRNYEFFARIYRHPELTLVARSEYHKIAIENAWNTPVSAVIEDCDMEKFFGI